jgi:hypothetical protein
MAWRAGGCAFSRMMLSGVAAEPLVFPFQGVSLAHEARSGQEDSKVILTDAAITNALNQTEQGLERGIWNRRGLASRSSNSIGLCVR